ncbi:hypothetical protein FS749_013334 [Ceratobasidium sp. UAMH 11750]|nr:hypothetical protein FS749_013334 [Ceratobasidium sp. UAMH 11750]
MPADLLSLARSNKFFRKIFMSRSSQYIWQATFKNLPDLPPCPPELCEPQYASLIFSKTCSKCGGRALRRMDPYLHVRLCNSCRDAEIVEIGALSDFYPLLPRSILIKEPSYGCVYTLVREYNKILEHANDKKTFPAWSKARLVEIVERQERGEELEDFLDFMEDERDLEIEDLKMRRQDEIETRLLEHGWTKRDMIPSPANLVQWKKLVWQPKPITDRIWTNLYPKLVPLLGSNRTFNDAADKAKRRHDRISKLEELVTNIRSALPPLVHVTLKRQGSSEPSTSAAPNHSGVLADYPDVKVEMPFPAMAELLTWPIIKNIIDQDTLPEDAEASFEGIREEFNLAVVEWRDKIEQDLIEIWNAGRAEDGEDEAEPGPSTSKGKGKAVVRAGTRRSTRKAKGDPSSSQSRNAKTSPDSVDLVLPEFVVTFTKPDGTTTNNLAELSPNMQILLRADTMFRSPSFYHTYPAIVPSAARFGMIIGAPDELMHGERWDASKVSRDDEGSAVAKVLLGRVGRLGATSAEMRALGMKFRCGRCVQTLPENWEGLVFHYTIEQRRWKQAMEKIKEEPKSQFVFNSTHDLEPGDAKPFAHFMTEQAAANFTIQNSTHELYMMTCKPCERMGIQARYFHSFATGVESSMEQHLRDVHNIAHAVPGLHFQRWELDPDFFDPFAFESDEDSEDDPWGLFG